MPNYSFTNIHFHTFDHLNFFSLSLSAKRYTMLCGNLYRSNIFEQTRAASLYARQLNAADLCYDLL